MGIKTRRASFPRMIEQFLQQRAATVLPPRELEAIRRYLLDLIANDQHPPRYAGHPDWKLIADICRIDVGQLADAGAVLEPGFDAVKRFVARRQRSGRTGWKPSAQPRSRAHRRGKRRAAIPQPEEVVCKHARPIPVEKPPRRKRGVKPKEIVEFPEPLTTMWEDPPGFPEAFKLHMERHGDTYWHLHRAVVKRGDRVNHKTFITWVKGTRMPRSVKSFEVLGRIERRYRLPTGYFKAKLPNAARATTGHNPVGISRSERRRIAWHLPDDFDRRSPSEQEEILEWVRRVIVTGSTDYRRFQAAAMKHRYAVRFPDVLQGPATMARSVPIPSDFDDDGFVEIVSSAVDAPPRLWEEMADLLNFKTSTLTAVGYQRVGVWGEETAAQKIEHCGLMFGALAASPRGAVRGLGVPLDALTFALLVFPAIWDWYLQWRERRRGFYTAWEVDMLRLGLALTRVETGWLRQNPKLAANLRPIKGLITQQDIDAVQSDWDAAGEACQKHCSGRVKEIQRVAQVHRDPFEPILCVLESDSPVGEYRKIADEILRTMPDERRYPRNAAEAVRSFLLIRIGLHTGLRQKNLRQLLLCPKGRMPTSERQLANLKVGELRWSERDNGWEILIPSIAFKNASSSYFGNKPFRLILPDIGELYRYLEDYTDRHRARLLNGAPDPGTFFVKTVKKTSLTAAYDQNTFYEAWRLVIQRYGIFNPYTGRGAIEGLLPHGPHNVRDILATHILKKTGSYEQASYAIQDTPEMVAKHYGRFLPQDKAALAARILNQVWDAA